MRTSAARGRRSAAGLRGLVAALATLLAQLIASNSRAQHVSAPSPHEAAVYSPYERQSIDRALSELGATLEADPDGKTIEHVEVVTLEVFEQRDLPPRFLNVFHVTTRERVVRRELLFAEGQRYDQRRIEDSARRLQRLRQLSVVLIVPYRGTAPDRVRVLVITKDVWSLRLNWLAEFDNFVLTQLVLQPSEENLFGTHAQLGALFRLRPDTYAMGAVFGHNRLFGSRIETRLNANVIVNRESGKPEGTSGYFYYGQPLYSLEASWAFKTVVLWNTGITRRYRRATQLVFDARPRERRGGPCDGWCVPYEYGSDEWFGSYEVTRSFGRRHKYDLTLGVEAQRSAYDTETLSEYDPEAVRRFRAAEVPTEQQRASPFFQLHAHSARFMRVINLDSAGLQESYQLGHDLWFRVYAASRSVASSRDLVGVFSAGAYTFPLGDGLLRAYAAHTAEFAGARQSDATLETGIYVATPRLGFGRLLYDFRLYNQYQNYLNQRVQRGGDSRPRGYPVGAFVGKDAVASTFEFRTEPVEILSAQLGGALFYDVGDAFDGFDSLVLHQSAGAGVRVLFPFLDRTVFRADWGVPVGSGAELPGTLFVSFQQAFPAPVLSPPSPASQFGLPTQVY